MGHVIPLFPFSSAQKNQTGPVSEVCEKWVLQRYRSCPTSIVAVSADLPLEQESVLIVVDGRAEDVYLFDCRPRPWLQQSYVAKFPTHKVSA